MKRLVLAVLFVAASVAWAQNPFNGTWKVSPSKVEFSQKPTIIEIKDGRWICSNCFPKIDVKADGTPQKITGSPYTDTYVVKLSGDNHAEVHGTKGGKPSFDNVYDIGKDGNTATIHYTDYTAANGQPQKGTTLLQRVGNAPASGSRVAGQWRGAKIEDASAASMTFTFSGSADELTYKAGTGEGYTAKLDGKDYPYKGDPGTTSVSLKKIDARTIEETDKRDGKPIFVSRLAVSADGKTMNIVGDDKLRDQTMKYTADKQ